ncbi:MAG: glycosyltransferase [Salaquimonas sp.]|nr:glycosyltransferase [Salaquimonas sp.]
MANTDAAERFQRVLLTNWQLVNRAGTECAVRDLATGLRRRGYRPIVYSPMLGELAEEIHQLGIPVIDDLRKLAEPPEVIHGQHLIQTAEAIIHFPSTPALYACHAWQFWVENPPRFPQILAYTAISETTRDRLVHTEGIDPAKVHIVHNAVDLARVPPRTERLARTIRRALCFTENKAHVPVLRAACKELGIEFGTLGRCGDRVVANPEQELVEYDLVFATGRSAIEALCCGAAVVVCDSNGLGGLVTSQSFARFKELNFALRSLTRSNTAETIVEVVKEYDRDDAERVTERARCELSLDDQLDLVTGIYRDLVSRWRNGGEADVDPSDFRAALIDFLHETLPRMPADNRWPWQQERELLTAGNTRLDAECEALRNEVSELQAEIASMRGQSTFLEDRIDALYSSTSWRLTAPLRWLKRRISA